MASPRITAHQFRQARSLVSRVRLALSSPRNTVRGCHDRGPGGNYDPAAAKWASAEHECREILVVRSGRGGRQPAEQVLAELEPMISALIKENHELHRQIDKLSKQTVGTASRTVERCLAVPGASDQRQPGRPHGDRSKGVGRRQHPRPGQGAR